MTNLHREAKQPVPQGGSAMIETEPIAVRAVNSAVTLNGGINAIIIAFSVRAGGYVQYECVWWIADGVRHSAWMTEAEITSGPGPTRTVGFSMDEHGK